MSPSLCLLSSPYRLQVVICAAVLSRSGRVLLSRAFTALSRNRMEGYLQSFPKLVGPDSQHTFIETESIRYVYQPMESIYVLLITNKQSNIMEDLESLRLFAKLLPEYCGGQSEEHCSTRVFELLFAVDELLTHGGYREHVTLQQIKTFTEMDSHEEKLQKIIMESKMSQARDEARRKASDIDHQKAAARQAAAMAGGSKYSSYGSENAPSRDSYNDRGPSHGRDDSRSEMGAAPTKKPESSSSSSSASKSAVKIKRMQLSKGKKTEDFMAQLGKEEKLAPATGKVGPIGGSSAASSAPAAKQSVRVVVDEKVHCVLDREGGIKKLAITGEIKLSIFDPADSKIVIQTTGALQEKDGFKSRLHPKIDKKAWTSDGALGLGDATKSFPVGSENAPIILKWRKESSSESDVPLTLNFWPNVENGSSVVSVEYSAANCGEIALQNVLVQIPCASREPPEVTNIEGEFKFDAKKQMLSWRIPQITPENQSGSLEFSIPEVDPDSFFPIEVSFDSGATLSRMGIVGVVQAENPEQEVEFHADTSMSVEKYTIE